MRKIILIIDKLNSLITHITGCLLMVSSVAVLTQVFVRFVLALFDLGNSAPWTEELARYALIWMVFLGSAVGVRHAQMISLEFVMGLLPKKVGSILRYGVFCLSIAFFVLLIWVGLQFVELGLSERSPVMGIQKSWVYWALPIGAVLMVLNSLTLIADTVLKGQDIRYAGSSETLEE